MILHKYVVVDLSSEEAKVVVNSTETNDVKWYDGSKTITVKLFFRELYNSILSLKSDINFAEKIKIDIKFSDIKHFAYGYIECEGKYTLRGKELIAIQKIIDPNPHLSGITLSNFCIMASYNQDTACNANTINYCQTHQIDMNDFHVNSTNIVASGTNHANYQFQVNSAMGPYLKFILYRNLNELGMPYRWEEGSKYRWFVNDFPWSIDYIRVNPEYQGFNVLIPRLKNCYYNNNRKEEYVDNYFDLLDFSNESLTNMINRSGRPLDIETKLTLDAYNDKWRTLTNGTNISHKFYIITGRLLTIGSSGIESII